MVSLNGTDVVYGVLPYFHAGGMLTVFGLLGLGVQIIVNRKFDSKRFLETLKNYQVNASLCFKFGKNSLIFIFRAQPVLPLISRMQI